MRNLLFAFCLLLVAVSGFAQKSPMKFGQISMEEMTMTSCAIDSSASAVILADYGEAYLSDISGMLFERHVRIKILRKDGVRWGNLQIPLYGSLGISTGERVSKLKAVTYNLENGAIVETPLSKGSIFHENVNRYINVDKIIMPEVRVGSVLEFSYTISSFWGAGFPNWQFQYEIPVFHSEYWALFPEFLYFEKYMQGYIIPKTYEVKHTSRGKYTVDGHHWVAKDIPAFREEPFMICKNDYISKINLAISHIAFPSTGVQEVMGTWEKLNTRLLESDYFGRVITGSDFLRKPAREVTAGITDTRQKVEAIFTYVQKKMTWDGLKDKHAVELKKGFDAGKGSAGDINLMLASMLEKVDVPVEMVLLSTRDHGAVRQRYPMERQFNYVICSVMIDGKTVFLDATDRYLPMGILPERCLNGQGLVISKPGIRWVDILPNAKWRTYVKMDLSVQASGELVGKMHYTHDGYAAREFRHVYFDKGEKEYLREFLADKGWDVESTEFQHQADVGKSVSQIHTLRTNSHSTVAGDKIYLNPFVLGQLKENLFKPEARQYPIELAKPEERTYMCSITIPEGYAVEELPKAKLLTLPNNGARYAYSVTQIGKQLNIMSLLQVNKCLFVMDEYAVLREFYDQLVAKQAEQIVLKKI